MMKKWLMLFIVLLGFTPVFAAVNINTATEKQLTTLSGIGPSKAKGIIEYRENNGIFKRIEDIQKVKGIGPAIFDKIKEDITVSTTPTIQNRVATPALPEKRSP